jgi:hypothetical protein
MEKVTQYLPLGLLVAFTAKLIAHGTTPAEAAVVFALTTLLSLEKYLNKSHTIQKIESNIQSTLADMQKIIEQQTNTIARLANELDTVRTNVSSMKLSQGMKRVG